MSHWDGTTGARGEGEVDIHTTFRNIGVCISITSVLHSNGSIIEGEREREGVRGVGAGRRGGWGRSRWEGWEG